MLNCQTRTMTKEVNTTDNMSSALEAESAAADQSQVVGSSLSRPAGQSIQDCISPALPPSTTISLSQFQNVSFSQKKTILEFIMAHRELALSESLKVDLWNELTVKLNTLGKGVRTCEEWKRVNRYGWYGVQNIRTEGIITFLESLADNEKKKTELKHFAHNIRSSVRAYDLLNMITSEPALAGNKDLIEMIDLLRSAEQMEEAYQTKADYHKKTLDDLMLKKEELDKNIETASKCLIKYQKDSFTSNHEKHGLLEKIRSYIRQIV